jgi:aconitase A
MRLPDIVGVLTGRRQPGITATDRAGADRVPAREGGGAWLEFFGEGAAA